MGALDTSDDESAFYDDWEDGDYATDPAWRVYNNEGDFRARVLNQSTPRSGQHVLQISETTGGGTNGIIGWQTGLTGWADEWTLSGLFYTQNVPLNSDFQGHNVILYDDPNENSSPLKAHLGFVDPRGNLKPFAIEGDLIDSVQKREEVNWAEDTWYHYAIEHDGDGTYTGRIWEDGTDRPTTPSAVSSGTPPGTEKRFASLQINGAHWRDFDINHAFMEWQTGTRNDAPTDELNDLIDRKETKIANIRHQIPKTWESDKSSIDARAEKFLETADDAQKTGTQAEIDQYREALTRLNDSEDLMLAATQGPVNDILPRSASVIINSVITLATEGLVKFSSGNLKDRALKFIHDRVLNSAKTVKNQTVNGSRWSIADPDELGSLFEDGYFKLSRHLKRWLDENPDTPRALFEEIKKTGGAVSLINGTKKLNQIYPDGLNDTIESVYEDIKTGLNELLYKVYYYDNLKRTIDLSLPDLSVPNGLDFEIGVPEWLAKLPKVPNEIGADVDLPTDEYLGEVDDLEENISETEAYLNALSSIDPVSNGINSVMADSVDILANSAESNELVTDGSERRKQVKRTYEAVLEQSNRVFDVAFGFYDWIGGVITDFTVAAFSALVATIVVSLAVGKELAVLFEAGSLGLVASLLFEVVYILGFIDLIFVGAQAVTLGGAILYFQQIHGAGVLAVNNLDGNSLGVSPR